MIRRVEGQNYKKLLSGLFVIDHDEYTAANTRDHTKEI
jgi:hypothetical protein